MNPDLAHVIRGQRVAVFGGTGVIGTAVVTALAQLRRQAGDRAPIYAVSRGLSHHRVHDVTYVQASVVDEAAMRAVPEADLALFIAGATSDYLANPLETIRVSTEGFMRFLDRTANATRRVLVGSARLYGTRAWSVPLMEDAICELRSPETRNVYDATKLLCEALALHQSTPNHPISMVRLGNVYGPSFGRRAATSFHSFLEQARRERRITVRAPGSVRNNIDARDAALGLLSALAFGRTGEAYNIGSTDHITNDAFARQIAAAMPFPVTVEHATTMSPPDFMVLSIDKAARELHYSPVHTIDEALPVAVRQELESP